MCGIVGYAGGNQTKDILLGGLKRLEYRGYDSAGVAISREGGLSVVKAAGRLFHLEEKLGPYPRGAAGIGHTRWATHGAPDERNAHPHTDAENRFAVVHNGIIENYIELKKELEQKGVVFRSDTDSEVVAHLLAIQYEGSVMEALRRTVSRLVGSYALGVVSSYAPGEVFAVRKDSPLIAGLGKGENFLASDLSALLPYTREVYLLEDGTFVHMTRERITLTDRDGREITQNVYHIPFAEETAQKGGYRYFMEKEIFDQPQAVRDTAETAFSEGGISGCALPCERLRGIRKVFFLGCGTAYHAGLVGKQMMEELAKLPAEAELASEFRYRDPMIGTDTLIVLISQSGETADTLAALRMGKRQGASVLAVTNVASSSMAREADGVFLTRAGLEIAVASTKAYTTQITALATLALHLAQVRETLLPERIEALRTEISTLPEKLERVLAHRAPVSRAALRMGGVNEAFYLGRGLDYAAAQEGALKMKEISYIHAQAYAGGELKHGPIALVGAGSVVVSIVTNPDTAAKMASNVEEVAARGAYCIGIVMERLAGWVSEVFDEIIPIPNTDPCLAGILSAVPLQLLAYEVCLLRGLDPDKPRNLAKSVTVE